MLQSELKGFFVKYRKIKNGTETYSQAETGVEIQQNPKVEQLSLWK